MRQTCCRLQTHFSRFQEQCLGHHVKIAISCRLAMLESCSVLEHADDETAQASREGHGDVRVQRFQAQEYHEEILHHISYQAECQLCEVQLAQKVVRMYNHLGSKFFKVTERGFVK